MTASSKAMTKINVSKSNSFAVCKRHPGSDRIQRKVFRGPLVYICYSCYLDRLSLVREVLSDCLDNVCSQDSYLFHSHKHMVCPHCFSLGTLVPFVYNAKILNSVGLQCLACGGLITKAELTQLKTDFSICKVRVEEKLKFHRPYSKSRQQYILSQSVEGYAILAQCDPSNIIHSMGIAPSIIYWGTIQALYLYKYGLIGYRPVPNMVNAFLPDVSKPIAGVIANIITTTNLLD